MKRDAAIVWFRQDLRLEDNPALCEALACAKAIIPLYVWAPEDEGDWTMGGAGKWWLHYSLQSLDQSLRTLGAKLIVRKGKKALAVLQEVIHESKVKCVFWNRRYEPAAIERDAKIKSQLHDAGIECRSFNGSLLFEPWTIMNKQGGAFRVFTPFWRACLKEREPAPPLPAPMQIPLQNSKLASLSPEELNLLPKIHWDAGLKKSWTPGAAAAINELQGFLEHSISGYHEKRDRPDEKGTSKLSPHLHFGEISPRTIWHKVKKLHGTDEPGTECYLRQLGWREFAYHLLYHFPFTPAEPLRKEFSTFPWSQDESGLKAWQSGKTGYPIVDAGMRELWTTGWMHNRVRMIAGSFLVKDLLLPWQEGAKWFWDTLVDADLANNSLGWQWIGGCGADAAPYFRIFNPVSQGEKFDPEGSYVRKWIPELQKIPRRWIHKPWEADAAELKKCQVELGKNYPFPIVEHAKARAKALAAFHSLKTLKS